MPKGDRTNSVITLNFLAFTLLNAVSVLTFPRPLSAVVIFYIFLGRF